MAKEEYTLETVMAYDVFCGYRIVFTREGIEFQSKEAYETAEAQRKLRKLMGEK